jgi:hypothetical protein
MADGSSGNELNSNEVSSADAAQSSPAYDPDKDHISTLLLELGQATALVDLLLMIANDSDVESLHEDTLSNSLYAVIERLRAVKVAADAILDEGSPGALKQEVAHG